MLGRQTELQKPACQCLYSVRIEGKAKQKIHIEMEW